MTLKCICNLSSGHGDVLNSIDKFTLPCPSDSLFFNSRNLHHALHCGIGSGLGRKDSCRLFLAPVQTTTLSFPLSSPMWFIIHLHNYRALDPEITFLK